MATRAAQFDELVLDAASRMELRAGKSLGDVEFAVEDVPPSDPAPWEHSDVPLGRLFAAQGPMPARIVVYRRPLMARSETEGELSDLVFDVVVEEFASFLGLDPDSVDPGYRGGLE